MHHKTATRTAREPAPETKGRTIRWARLYDFATTFLSFGRAGALRRTTIDLAQPAPGEKVLDVGCGPGTLALAAKQRVGAGGEVHGIDAAPEMIELAREKAAKAGAAIDFQVGLIERIPFPDNYFDLATSTLMFHHLPGDLKRSGLAEILRVLKPGGHLLLVDFASHAESGLGHLLAVFGLSKDRSGVDPMRKLLQEARFANVEVLETKHKQLAFVRALKGT